MPSHADQVANLSNDHAACWFWSLGDNRFQSTN